MADDDLAQAAARLVAAGALGRSPVLRKLFDFLLERSAAGAAPKETEVALTVFGDHLRPGAPQDASVRVYVHRLRLKLAAYYSGRGRDDPVRIEIPKGEYRLVAQGGDQAGGDIDNSPPPRSGWRLRRPWLWVGVGAAALTVLNVGLWAVTSPRAGIGEIAQERRAAPWASLLNDARPITVVIGDYYIFGEIDRAKGVDRLLREYAINSPLDLDDYRMTHPQVESRYIDLDLYYLPVSAALALRNIMPLLAPTAKDRDRVHIVLASDVTPDMLRRNNIVYIGYLSGLGILRNPVFAGSRFSVGATYDELIDTAANKRYASQEGGPDPIDQQQQDLGYISTFPGPTGARIVIIAGARDMGVTQMAEEAVNTAALAAMTKAAGGAGAFEAVYEVHGYRRANLGGKLVVAAPLRTDRIWSQNQPPLRFPNG
jgi:hypothetical protein